MGWGRDDHAPGMAARTGTATLPPAASVSDAERARLLAIARLAVTAAARGAPRPSVGPAAERDPERAAEHAPDEGSLGAAFVTLLDRGGLRGCIGLLDPSRPLAESVAMAAFSAARDDVRFRPVREAELPGMEIEVSVLGPMTRLDDPLAFRLGVDGVVVERGLHRGLLLPEVAPEHGLDARAMLETTCRKAGLPHDAWRDPGTTVSAFRTVRFGGPALG